MTRISLLAACALLLVACGDNSFDRTSSGAGTGAGTGALIGLIGGPVGVVVGAGIGAGVGAVAGGGTKPQDVNLGQPIWKGKGDDQNAGDQNAGPSGTPNGGQQTAQAVPAT
jgi:hypothetical protein